MGSAIALACILTFGAGHGQGQVEWKRYQLEDGLVAAFPKQPSKEVLHKDSLEIHRFTGTFGMGLYRVAAYSETPEQAKQIREELADNPGGPAVRALMKSVIDGSNNELKGTISDLQFGGFKGLPMERCRIDTGHVVVYIACVCNDRKLIALLTASPKGTEDLDRIQKFFDSLELQ